MLIDSGSSHGFVSGSSLTRVNIQIESTKATQVTMANGEVLLSDKWVPGMEWWSQGHIFHTNMRVLELGACDAILEFDLLKLHSPMQYHWENKKLEFMDKGIHVKLQGLQQAEQEVVEIPVEQLCKWLQGNEV